MAVARAIAVRVHQVSVEDVLVVCA
jgi:hypothetical protein